MIVVNARFVSLRFTGVQRSAFEIVRRLANRTDDPETTRSYILVSPPGSANATTLPVKHTGTIRQGHFWEQLELPKTVRQYGTSSILYSPMTSGPILVSRQVATVHDLFPVDHPEWFSKKFSVWYRALWPLLLHRAAYTITNSEYTRRRILDRYGTPEDKVVTCHFAHGEAFAPTGTLEVDAFRAERQLPARYALCIGSVEPRKNLTMLARAWSRTAAQKKGVKLLVAGRSAPAAVFNVAESGAEALERHGIRWLGFFPDEHLPLLYQGAEVFLLPSLAEGFGLPVLEAMACGTPVICSDNTALPEVAGGAARLVPATEPEAWTEAIDLVLGDPLLRDRMREAGIARASQFSWDKTADGVRSVLERV